MDNKYRFMDRSRVMPKNEVRREPDPYIFGEPEPIAKKSMVTASPRNAKWNQNGKAVSSKSRGKCLKSRPGRGDERVDSRLKHRLLEVNRKQRQQSRDHMLLYYPRAGDEISDSESSGDETMMYQRHWFFAEPNTALTRSARLSQLRSQLRRHLIQLSKCDPDAEAGLRQKTRCLVESAYRDAPIRSLNMGSGSSGRYAEGPLLVGGECGAEGCRQLSLPCTRHCSRHIMMNADQLLFEHCTAKFADNTQCCVPVFDVTHELPLCPEHARKKDNYQRKSQESKPKKARKKAVSPTVPRPKAKSRPKKRKRPPPSASPLPPPPPPPLPVVTLSSPVPPHASAVPQPMKDSRNANLNDATAHFANQIINDSHAKTLNNLNVPPSSSNAANLNLGLGLGSLGLGNSLKVDITDHEVFASLDPTEHDFGNVLNNLPADAFNDLFIESRNGEYEPSREEEEELERALEAVDKDVRNLERMGQTHGLLEPALLAQLMSDIAS